MKNAADFTIFIAVCYLAFSQQSAVAAGETENTRFLEQKDQSSIELNSSKPDSQSRTVLQTNFWYTEWQGRVLRTRLNRVHFTNTLPQVESILLAGTHSTFHLLDDKIIAKIHGGLGVRWSASFRTLAADGKEESLEPSDKQRLASILALREAYFTAPQRGRELLIGKQLVGAGPALAASLVNPLASTTNAASPYDDRYGSWLVSWKLHDEDYKLAIYASPGVLEDTEGWPKNIWRYQLAPGTDKTTHAQAAAHLVFPFGSASTLHSNAQTELGVSISALNPAPEVNMVIPQAGFSLLREKKDFGSMYAEANFKQGSENWRANGECLGGRLAINSCLAANKALLIRPKLYSKSLESHFLGGVTRNLSENALLRLEFIHDTFGESDDEFENILAVNADARAISKTTQVIKGKQQLEKALFILDQNFGKNKVLPLRSKNYLFGSMEQFPLQRWALLSFHSLLSLRDNSGVCGPRLTMPFGIGFSEISGLLPFSLGKWKSVKSPQGNRVSEADTINFRYKIEGRLYVKY